MGIIDFVKGGVQRMMIARDDAHKDKVIYKHPDQTFPFWSQLTVDSDECCLFFKDGNFVGILGPGRHTLQTQNIPFLNALVDKFTGGNVFISELYFVTTRPMYNQTFGDTIGSMRDPELDIRVNPRAFGTFSFRVADPYKFVVAFVGQGGNVETAMRWIRDLLFMGLKSTLARLIKSGEMTLMDLGTAGPEVARAIVQGSPDLANCGVQVLEIGKLNINLSEEDQKRIDEMQDQIVQAKINARKAKIAVGQAEAEAQARQFQLDQEFMNRARYVNQLDMQRYQQYAAAEATMGLGHGLAQGGEGAAAGAAGAAMLGGMGLGAGMMYGARAPMPYGPPPGPPGYPPPGHPYAMPGYFPPGYPAPGYAPPGYPQPVPPGAPPVAAPPAAAAPPAVAAPPAAAPPAAVAQPGSVRCASCGAQNPQTARFCSECGRQIAA